MDRLLIFKALVVVAGVATVLWAARDTPPGSPPASTSEVRSVPPVTPHDGEKALAHAPPFDVHTDFDFDPRFDGPTAVICPSSTADISADTP